MTLSLRQRLLALAVLGTVACSGALFAIVRLATHSSDQRLDRARDVVTREIERLRDTRDAGLPPRGRPGGGMRRRVMSGITDDRAGPWADATQGAGPNVRAAVADAMAACAASGALEIRTREARDGTVVAAALVVAPGSFAWATARVPPQEGLEAWRVGVGVLAAATLLLVLASLQTMFALARGTSALRGTLGALSLDLRARVERPAVRELGQIADGISSLAAALGRSQEEQARLTRELTERERLATLGRVAAGVAHEVRNPLASIKLRVDLACRSPGTPPMLARDLADVSAEVARLDRLVTDLMDVSGRRSGPRVECDLGALVRKRVALLAPWAETHRVALSCDGDASAPVDADSVARAVDNLLRNAVEASPEGAAVRAEVRADADAARVTIADQGPGVPAGRERELFEPFFTTKPDGTGLGLALSRAIAVTHGGALVYDRAGGWTRFTLTVARAAPPQREA